MSIVLTQYAKSSMLADTFADSAVPHDGTFQACFVALYTNPTLPLDDAMQVSSFTQPTEEEFPGYAPIGPVAWKTPHNDDGGTVAVLSDIIEFSPETTGTGCVIRGIFCYKEGISETPLLFSEETFQQAVVTELDSYSFVMKIKIGDGDYGQSTVLS